jgi:regulator of RNase E activity RraA
LREGSLLVIEEAPLTDVGSIGSNNIMGWKVRGCVGVITSGTARDTDEIAAQGIPLYYRKPGRGIRPGRNEIESVNRPIVVGGVLVMPGDVVVADGDGVIVVPRAHAERVAIYARETLETDKAARRGLYEKLGLPEDDSVR